MAAHNNRMEALRIVATVLDFSREERARVGLEAGTPGRGAVAKGGPQTQVSISMKLLCQILLHNYLFVWNI